MNMGSRALDAKLRVAAVLNGEKPLRTRRRLPFEAKEKRNRKKNISYTEGGLNFTMFKAGEASEPKPKNTRSKKPKRTRSRKATPTPTPKPKTPKPTITQKNNLLMELGLLPAPRTESSKPKTKGNKRGGFRAKDAVISDNFNPDKNDDAFEIDDLLTGVALQENQDLPALNGLPTLDDLRALYKAMGGKAKLQKMMANDQSFGMILKELLKAEIDLMKTKMRTAGKDAASGGVKEKYVFVVIKGLEPDVMMTDAENGDIDLMQIRNAVDPSILKQEAEEDKPKSGAPEMLFGAGGGEYDR